MNSAEISEGVGPSRNTSGNEADKRDRAFFGHPAGLLTLFFAEMWERFSYYGMRAILALFMTTATVDGGLGFSNAQKGVIYALYTSLVYFAGLAFTFRDLAQERVGRRWIVAAIVAGAVISGLVSTKFALASGAAFLVSELLDFAVYTPLRRRNWIGAVVASNVVGLVADSVLFLALAFGSLAYLPGQVVGKAWMTVLAVAILWLVRRRVGPSPER